ncbi:hypothetical protein SAMN04487912_101540 [Arthrobacter sp. cf158]|uniref:hypothetical protein n=1 Tax=Arthrobacter sp. cf158 TaxID=1761744 RepID=UPI00089D8E2F|nr:hypothetical protein [Arthrobacter sp. cf158]SDW14137.1 hypothetical protein SAMN04487912_101540 [Arthrobacter sp. cf158]
MNNLIFWIIVCSWLIPFGIRMYNRSKARRLQDGGFRGPGYPPQNLPGPGYPPQGHPQQYPGQQYPGQQYPGQPQPGPGYPPQGYPGYPSEPIVIRPADDAPQAAPASSPSAPAPFPAAGGTEPQGYRARKLADLDAKFSNGEIAMEDYMKQRADIMNG